MHTPTLDRPVASAPERLAELHHYHCIRDRIEAVGSLVDIANEAAKALDSEVSDSMTTEQKTLVIERVWDGIVRAVTNIGR